MIGCMIRNAMPTSSKGAAEITAAGNLGRFPSFASPKSKAVPEASAMTANPQLIHRKIVFRMDRDAILAPIRFPIHISKSATCACSRI